jgi:cell wall-associated NlpC family hydrolase
MRPRAPILEGMRRASFAALLAAAIAALGSAPAHGASWAQPQIRVVVAHGLMGPSVAAFRPGASLTRRDLGQAIANLTGRPQVVTDPDKAVLMRQLEGALARAAGLGPEARRFRRVAREAGLRPPARFGVEVVARLLGLRYNHPAARDARELRPQDVATRAEAAYSLAGLVQLDDWSKDSVAGKAASFSLPSFTTWQRRVIRRAVSFVGFPYVWGGTSENTQTLFGVTSRGGFDCSGFVWRVYRRPFSGAPQLATVLRGRTTYEMSGEFPRRQRIRRAALRPGDLVFFGASGRSSSPSEVNHMGIYAGNGWFVHSSGQGTTLTTLTGWYADTFAWGRRPLREAGLA